MHGWYYNGPDMFWIFIAIIVVSSMLFSYLKSRSRDDAIRDLAQRGQPIPAEMFRPTSRSRGGLLIGGLVMLFIGIALSAFMWAGRAGVPNFGNEAFPALVGLFPGGIGLALLLSYFLLGRDRDGGY